MTLANEAWRTAGKLWMLLARSGHGLRCRHPRRTPPDRVRAACEMDRLTARVPLVYIDATFREGSSMVLPADEASREDNSLEVMIDSSARALKISGRRARVLKWKTALNPPRRAIVTENRGVMMLGPPASSRKLGLQLQLHVRSRLLYPPTTSHHVAIALKPATNDSAPAHLPASTSHA